jgi:hypothetical protein
MAPNTPPNPGLSTHSLSHNLSHLVEASKARTADAQRVFYPVATLWDSYLQSEDVRKLPAHLRKPLTKLCSEITAITNLHFESYIRGIYTGSTIKATSGPALSQETPPSISPSSASPPPAPSPASSSRSPSSQPSPSYASITAAAAPAQVRKPQKPSAKATTSRPDTRLFLRISPDHPARAAGSFAVLTGLKAALGIHAPLLKEALAIPSGYALCTSSLQDLEALTQHSTLLADTIVNCKVERPQPWVTYRAVNIPRTVRLLDPLNQVQNHLVTDQILNSAIQDVTGQQPVQATETRGSLEQGLFGASWLVHFLADAHKPLPRSLRILGTVVQLRKLESKPKTIQCTRCFQWHNTRTCTRPQHCRTCGSSNHTEETHPKNCNAALPHQCPPKCLHCKGPHPADDPLCPLRPVPLCPKSAPEKLAITTASKAAWKRATTAVNCNIAPRTDVVMASDTPTTPTRPSPGTTQAPSTTPAPRFFNPEASNVFAPLLNEN